MQANDSSGWRPGGVLRLLSFWTAITTLIFWLPLVRSLFDGPTYEWGAFGGLRGRGLEGDLWFPAAGVAFALTLQWLGWRGARFPFHALLLSWHFFLAGGATYLALTTPESFVFRGDTLGIELSLAAAGPLLFGGFALLAAFWCVRDVRAGRPRTAPPWRDRNRKRLLVLAGLLPIQFVLLRFGEPHGLTDALGVLLTIGQWLAVGWALSPAASSQRPDSARSASARRSGLPTSSHEAAPMS